MSQPSHRIVESLPHWAKVAFAARCARRIQPFFIHFWPNAPAEHVTNVDDAISLAEKAARDADDRPIARRADYTAAIAAHGPDHADVRDGAVAVARAAALAAHAVKSDAHLEAFDAQEAALEAALASSPTHYDATRTASERDLARLRQAAEENGWTDDTPVPSDILGPLWHDRVPEGWPTSDR